MAKHPDDIGKWTYYTCKTSPYQLWGAKVLLKCQCLTKVPRFDGVPGYPTVTGQKLSSSNFRNHDEKRHIWTLSIFSKNFPPTQTLHTLSSCEERLQSAPVKTTCWCVSMDSLSSEDFGWYFVKGKVWCSPLARSSSETIAYGSKVLLHSWCRSKHQNSCPCNTGLPKLP